MNDVEEIEERLIKRFFSDYDLEAEIVKQTIGCRTRDQYLALVRAYSLGKMRDVCCQNFTTNLDPIRVFKNLKICQSYVDFI